MKPAGGTELQHEFLKKHVASELLDHFQICTSVPGKVPIAANKINILWQKMAPDQPHFQEFFKDPEQIKQYDYYVFNSHWNYEQFRKQFNIPLERCTVIKNGILDFKKRDPAPKRDKIKLIYHPTPWRGLSIESLACGLFVVTTDNGALYETCSEFPVYVPYDNNFKNLAHQFAAIIDGIPDQINSKGCHNHLRYQSNFFNHFYNWKNIAGQWEQFLKGALNARPQ